MRLRRHRFGRACAALLLLWFAAIVGAPSALHSCAVHGTGGAAAPEAEHSAHSHQLPDGADHSACTCFGDCAAGGVPPAIPVARATFALAASDRIRAPLPAPDAPAVTTPAFLLPYANGPPGTARVAYHVA
jgi:hypothetical protein